MTWILEYIAEPGNSVGCPMEIWLPTSDEDLNEKLTAFEKGSEVTLKKEILEQLRPAFSMTEDEQNSFDELKNKIQDAGDGGKSVFIVLMQKWRNIDPERSVFVNTNQQWLDSNQKEDGICEYTATMEKRNGVVMVAVSKPSKDIHSFLLNRMEQNQDYEFRMPLQHAMGFFPDESKIWGEEDVILKLKKQNCKKQENREENLTTSDAISTETTDETTDSSDCDTTQSE